MALTVKRTYVLSETVRDETGRPLQPPKRVVVACAVMDNPYAGTFQEDFGDWIAETCEPLGTLLADLVLEPMDRPVEAYGKAAVVGDAGDVETGSAVIHNLRFGNPLRDRIGATTLLPAVEKTAAPGAPFDIPLKHITDDRTRSHHQTVTVQLPGHPLANELLIGLAVTDAGRPHARIGGFGQAEAKP